MNYTLAIDNIDPSKLFSKGKFVGKIKLVPIKRTILAKQPNKAALEWTGNALSNFVLNQNVEQVAKTNERKDVPYINVPATKRIAKMHLNLLKLIMDGKDRMNIEENISKEDIQSEVEQPVAEAIAPVAVEQDKEPTYEKYEMPTAISEEPVAMVSEPTEAPSLTQEVSNTVGTEIPAPVYQEDVTTPSIPEVSKVVTKSGDKFPSIIPTDSSMDEVGELVNGVTKLRDGYENAVKEVKNMTTKCSTLQDELSVIKSELESTKDEREKLKTELADTVAEMNIILGESENNKVIASKTQEENRRLQSTLDGTTNELERTKIENARILHLYTAFKNEVQGAVRPITNDNKTRNVA